MSKIGPLVLWTNMPRLVLLRHGQSAWNLENKFTGWTDVDLSKQGELEARAAAKSLAAEGFDFDCCYTSVLTRAIRTLWITLEELDRRWLPVYKDWRLNERHYGKLQGRNKVDVAREVGEHQLQEWRRGYDARPPEVGSDDPRHPRRDPRYRRLPSDILPSTESLADTVRRLIPFYKERIIKEIRAGERVLIVAHGNSLRALVKHLDRLSDSEITKVNIPTGIPLVYELDADLCSKGHHYLGDPVAVSRATKAVATQAQPT